jgi:hypothetical protein
MVIRSGFGPENGKDTCSVRIPPSQQTGRITLLARYFLLYVSKPRLQAVSGFFSIQLHVIYIHYFLTAVPEIR